MQMPIASILIGLAIDPRADPQSAKPARAAGKLDPGAGQLVGFGNLSAPPKGG